MRCWLERVMQGPSKVFIYYASSDTRLHVATSSIERLVDYVMNTPEDGLRSEKTVSTIYRIIENNEGYKDAFKETAISEKHFAASL